MKTTKRVSSIWGAISLMLLFTQPCQAEGIVSVGLGTFTGAGEYKGSDGNNYTLPLVAYESDEWSVNPLRVEYHLGLTKALWVDAIAAFRLKGFDEDLSRYTRGMEERDHSLDAGFAINSYSSTLGLISLEVLHDISSVHKGYEVSLAYLYPIEVDSWSFMPTIFVERQSDKLVDYYYGVRANEVNEERAAYQGESSMNYGVAMAIDYQINKSWSLQSSASWRQLDDSITDSPLVDSDTSWDMGLSVFFSF
ncbi:MipA/OmpV family protein [Catenovulum sp. SM1970]|uniref:MipA/OmpV family protein n=1 Tax=Marinifaba aquimaris TaxID=2741323 RepID=UPI0015726E14|nr:MipA/OmpV family protein [Marinifaba aquimaris]NTS77516.1 MipA/OmpV family protein [Marinifaba aquimaris]